MSLLWDWQVPMSADLLADASAALGIIGRTGLGKMRHIDTSYLWLQQDCIKEKIKMQKVLGTENPADMNTKGLKIEQIDKFSKMLRMEHRSGRADLAPEMHKLLHKEICERFNSTSAMITKRPRRGKTEKQAENKMSFEKNV